MSILAVAAPLLAKTVLPLLGKGVVKLMDKIHGRGDADKNPTKKFDAVVTFRALMSALEQTLPGLSLPVGDEVGALIEQYHAELKAAGVLKGFDTEMEDPTIPSPSSPSSPSSPAPVPRSLPAAILAPPSLLMELVDIARLHHKRTVGLCYQVEELLGQGPTVGVYQVEASSQKTLADFWAGKLGKPQPSQEVAPEDKDAEG